MTGSRQTHLGRGCRQSLFLIVAAVLVCGVLTAPRAGAVTTVTPNSQGLSVHRLQVNGDTNPLAVIGRQPAFGWQLAAARRGVLQSAYRILVATRPDSLSAGASDVWDSGKVISEDSTGVSYRGPALRAGQRYYWKVRVWGNHGELSDWSTPAHWEAALESAADWKGARWITPKQGEQDWSDFTLDADVTIRSAAASVIFRAEDDSHHYLWQINTVSTTGKVLLRPHKNVGGSFTTLKEVDISSLIPPADTSAQHHLRIRAEGHTITTWVEGQQVDTLTDESLDSGTIGFRASTTSGIQERALYDNLAVHDLDGKLLFSDDFSVSPDPSFPGAAVNSGQLEPTGDPVLLSDESSAPMLRKTFTLDKPVASARAYIYGLGFYELRLNGGKVGDQVLTPASTPYQQRNLYDTYDVTRSLKKGSNGVGMWLGNGYGRRFNPYGFRWTGPKQAIVLIDVTFADGSRRSITSDTSWKWSKGPVVANDIYDGETYDARAEQPGWDTGSFDDASWNAVAPADAPSDTLAANTMTPMRVTQSLSPVRITEPEPGTHIYDFGQNFAGWARLTAQGQAGTAIAMRTAEELNADGTLDTATNRNAASTDTFVLAGTGKPEVYEPRFTYHGFRYLQVTGYPGKPTGQSVTGRVVHADVASLASFASSSTLLNRIWQNNRWSILNNSMSIPTDTPVRDERTPPGMDVQAYHDASVTSFDMDTFYAKYLQDMPPGTALPNDSHNAQQPDMGGNQISLAWALYEQYGDKGPLRAAYPKMKTFVDSNAATYPDHIWPENKGFGDWCPPFYGPGTNDGMGSPEAGSCTSEVSLVNTALSYRQASVVAKAAQALGERADAAHFAELAGSIKRAFNDHFLNAAGDTYGDGRQTTSILPLAFGMVPTDRLEAVGDRLVDTIVRRNNSHLDTGIFGTRYLMDALRAIGRTDLAITMLGQTTYPGFGFQISRGATSSWEQWLYASSMETHDHAMFAGINASFITVLGGIRPMSPGYRTFLVDPEVPKGLDEVAARVDTVRGTVACEWTRSRHEGLRLTVTVPPGSTAVVRVPLLSPNAEVKAPAGATPAPHEGPTAYALGSGKWVFRAGQAA
ncbi:family 78 glycoside hydrolase catalytic domain [Streptomyces sp. NPDC102365]|uniref:family 78 glycoside hydrolase catalytic domain n=1 Tax=Streptomyces sp. NPDC102365 TaxID=3366162 RepID=UPI003827E1B9